MLKLLIISCILLFAMISPAVCDDIGFDDFNLDDMGLYDISMIFLCVLLCLVLLVSIGGLIVGMVWLVLARITQNPYSQHNAKELIMFSLISMIVMFFLINAMFFVYGIVSDSI